jgi:hypothetical protein
MLKYGAQVAVLGVVWLAIASVASAQYVYLCSNATIAGQYGFLDTGEREIDGKLVSYDAVRTAQFSGEGKHEGKGYLSIGGKISRYTVRGTFTVVGDCTFTLDAIQTLEDGRPPQPYKQYGVVVRGGKEILAIQITSDKNQTEKYQRMVDY